MAITRKVDTDVYCDICGKWVMGWTSNNDGVSRAWAAKYARKKGCTVQEKFDAAPPAIYLSLEKIVQLYKDRRGDNGG